MRKMTELRIKHGNDTEKTLYFNEITSRAIEIFDRNEGGSKVRLVNELEELTGLLRKELDAVFVDIWVGETFSDDISGDLLRWYMANDEISIMDVKSKPNYMEEIIGPGHGLSSEELYKLSNCIDSDLRAFAEHESGDWVIVNLSDDVFELIQAVEASLEIGSYYVGLSVMIIKRSTDYRNG